MTLNDLFEKSQRQIAVIYTGQQYYTDCLLWLHQQGAVWIDKSSLIDQRDDMKTRAIYDAQTCLCVTQKKEVFCGKISRFQEADIAFMEYEDLFRTQHVTFDDLDAILSERSQL